MHSQSLTKRPGRFGHMLAATTLTVLTTACSSTSNSLGEVRQLPPCPVRIGIENFPSFPSAGGQEVMEASASREEMREMLFHSLTRARTASEVQLLPPNATDEQKEEFDLILTPNMRKRPTFAHDGWASTWWASGSLWLLTWVGGLAVNDSSYRSDMRVDFNVEFPATGASASHSSECRMLSTTFFERNDLMSWPTVQSLVLPPFLTTDQADTTITALTQGATDGVAADLARALKQNFVKFESEDKCSLEVRQPTNGATVNGSSVSIAGMVKSTDVAREVTVELLGSGKGEQKATLQNSRTDNVPRLRNRVDFSHTVTGLEPGRNYIRIAISAGDRSTRTIVVDCVR